MKKIDRKKNSRFEEIRKKNSRLVFEELLSMDDDEFQKKLNEHMYGDIANILYESGILIKEKEEELNYD